ncbi:MAG: pentapeptide repeat-containing protein, partial [Solirubrobacterales bacterium]|nr:pentapeptide repeat-containing protein [Solirubrobacterales bacterium]
MFALDYYNTPNQQANLVVIPHQWLSKVDHGCDYAVYIDLTSAMTSNPNWLILAPDTAVELEGGTYPSLTSLWGAQSISLPNADPGQDHVNWFPGRGDWQATDKVIVMPQEQYVAQHHSCRYCSLVGDHILGSSGPLDPYVAYQHDLTSANLTGATLTGDFSGWKFAGANLTNATLSGNFSGADLTGAVLDHTVVDGAVFDRADLRGAHLVGLQYQAPPSFVSVRIGPASGRCTQFQDIDLLRARFVPSKPDPGCGATPLLPGSLAPLGLLYALGHDYHGMVDVAGAQYVASAADRTRLAGVDLSGIDLSGASFLGFPADFSKTKFDGASLQGTSFELADLSGASLHNVHAAGASFQDAALAADGNTKPASFAGAQTDLSGADFVGADVSGVSFQSAELSGAAFNRAKAVDTDFNSVVAKNAVFSGAHIYGDGQAFDAARDLTGADFAGAVLAGSNSTSRGFDFTDVNLTGAKFDRAQCIACTFTGSTLTRVS